MAPVRAPWEHTEKFEYWALCIGAMTVEGNWNLIRQEGAAVALPTPGYQIRNTFIHINEAIPKRDWKASVSAVAAELCIA